MKPNRTQLKWKQNGWQWVVLVLAAFVIFVLPVNLIFADEIDPPEVSRGVDEFRYPTEEDNRDLTRGMMYMGGLMVLIVVAGTLRVLRLDQVNRPHLQRPRQKRQLPDATIKKSPRKAPEKEPSEEK
jgi:hypothetical protein